MKTIKEQIIEALQEYEGTDFLVNDELIEFIENIKEQPKVYYFMFGEDVCRAYHENEFEVVLKMIEEGTEFSIHKFIEGEHPENIMEAGSGWMDYAIITEEEYNALNELD